MLPRNALGRKMMTKLKVYPGEQHPHAAQKPEAAPGGGLRNMPIQTENGFYATGRRKESTARVWMKDGNGTIIINGRPLDEYFGRETSKMILNQPLQILEQTGKVDVTVNVVGGGLSGQAGAIRHGLSRALCLLNPEFRPR